ncbi:MAG TPA: hypothetical protein VMB48_05340 [Steroidobacteraceae bacterium]|nr:hypothetical protein [Steroidobacteraceae bacterium]
MGRTLPEATGAHAAADRTASATAGTIPGGDRSRRLAGWAWSGLSTAAAQAIVQGLGFAAGILIVRWLPLREYAFYTIATAGLGTMTVLTDSGIGSSVLALGGAAWRDRARLGAVIATGIAMRRRFSRAALALGVPLMIILLRRQGASWSEALLVALSVVPAFLATVTGHLLESVPRLHQALVRLQLVQAATNAGRLLLAVLVVPFWPLAWLAGVLTALPQWWANLRLRRMADDWAAWRASPDAEIAQRMTFQVRRTMPGAVYYALSGQLTVWLISVFGRTGNVAAVGALSRLAMALSVLGLAFNALAVPRFARIPGEELSRIHRRYLQSQALYIAACAVPVALLALLPGPALALLGPHYGGLRHEAVLMGLGSIATLGCGAAYSLGAARGVIAPPSLTLPATLLVQALLIATLPLSTVAGVIWVGILGAIGQWAVHLAYFEWHCRRARAPSRGSGDRA